MTYHEDSLLHLHFSLFMIRAHSFTLDAMSNSNNFPGAGSEEKDGWKLYEYGKRMGKNDERRKKGQGKGGNMTCPVVNQASV